MVIEVYPESRFQLDDVAVTLKHIAIVKPHALRTQFIRDNRLILSEESVEIVKKMKNKVKSKILAVDAYRKKMDEERRNHEYYTSSSNIRMNDYNNRFVREFICGQLRYGV